MATRQNPHVLIIGGGLAGLTLAQVLRARDISFEIFERDTLYVRPQGWGIGLHSILEDLVANVSSDMPPIETVDHLQPFDLPPTAMYYNNDDGSRVGVIGKGDLSTLRADRRRLHEWLSSKIDVQWGKEVSSFEEDEAAETVTAHFTDGTLAVGNLLVGCDGMYSAMRKLILKREGVPDCLRVLDRKTLHANVEVSGETFERQLSFSNSIWRAATEKTESRPGVVLFVGLGRVSPDGQKGTYFWYLSSDDDEFQPPGSRELHTPKEKLLEMSIQQVQYLRPEFREIVEVTPADGICWPPYVTSAVDMDRAHLRPGRVILVGDAAHGMPPYRGEGGVQAMRDALKLADTITQIRDTKATKATLANLIGAYADEMLERGLKSVRDSIAAATAKNENRVIWGHVVEPIPWKKVSLAEIPFLESVRPSPAPVD